MSFCDFCRRTHKKTDHNLRSVSENTKYYTGTYRDEGNAGVLRSISLLNVVDGLIMAWFNEKQGEG